MDTLSTAAPSPRDLTGRPLPGRLAALGIAAILAATCLAYLPALHGQFLSDDDLLILDNPLIKSPDGLHRIWFTTEPVDYWPVTNSVFWVAWRLWGANPLGYHLLNLVLHTSASLLLWAVLRQLQIPGAFLAALLFAVHPVNVEAVAWASQAKSILALLFFLLSIFCYLKADAARSADTPPESGRSGGAGAAVWYALSLATCALAILSKGSVVILPLVLLGVIWWRHHQITLGDIARVAPFVLIAVPLMLVNIWFQTHGADTGMHSAEVPLRLARAGAVVWFYLAKAILPLNLTFAYPGWNVDTANPLDWLPLLATVLVTAGLWWWRNTGWGRPLFFAWFFFCVALIPVLGFVDVGFMQFSPVADRYQYVALIAMMTLVAAGWSALWTHARAPAQRALVFVPAAAAVSALMLLTARQCAIYHDTETLYRAALVTNASSPLVHNYLGCALMASNRSQEAIPCFEQALRLNPAYPDAENNLGLALLNVGRSEEAMTHFEQALRIKPDFALGHNSLGNVLLELGRFPEALDHFRQAVAIQPHFADAQNNLGVALLRLEQPREAIPYFEQALRLLPDFAQAHSNLASALLLTDRPQDAVAHLQAAVQFKPDSVEIWANLSNTERQLHHTLEADAAAQKALELARAQGDAALLQKIEASFNSASPNTPRSDSPSSGPALPPPTP